MNPFKRAAIAAVKRNGRDLTYTSIERIVDKINGTVTEVNTDRVLRIYPKSIRASQYNFPDLVGKEVVTFYLAVDGLGFKPKVNDTILLNGEVFTIRYYDFHEAAGENCLYRLTGATG